MSLPSQWNNEQDGLGGSLYDMDMDRPGSPFSLSDDHHRHHNHRSDALFGGLRHISVETIVSTPPSLPLASHPAYPTEDHETFKYLQQLKANAAGPGIGVTPTCLLATECHKDGSLFSIHSAPPVPLATDTINGGISTPLWPSQQQQQQSRPVSLALDPNTMLTVQFAAPVAAAHSTNAVDMPHHAVPPSEDADDEENENLWTVSSACSARPLIAKSRELRNNIRFMPKQGARTKTGKGSASGKSSADDGTSVGGVSKGSDYNTLDGGFGWLVVFGAFSVNFWVAGLVKSYGILYVEIMETFPNASAAVASWIPAILSALCLVLAPVSSALSRRFSCRLVVFIGGIFCALGLTLSYFATNLIHLFFTFGVLTGIGGGLSTTPGIIIVSQYFDKRRALANGMCVSGTAAGSFVFPMLIDRLIKSFGFHGTILVLGGCMLHVCISAVLYREPVLEPEAVTDDVDTTGSRSCHLKSVDTTQTLVSQNSSVLGTYLSASAEEPLNSCTTNNGNGKKIFIENLFLEEAKNRLNDLCQNNKLAPEIATKQDISDDEGKDFMGETIMVKAPFAKCMRSSSVYLHSVEDLSTDSTFVYKKRGSGHESNRGSRKRNKPAIGGGAATTATDGTEKKANNHSEKKDSIPSTAAEEELIQAQSKPSDGNDQEATTTAGHMPINRGLSKSMMIIPSLVADENASASLNKATTKDRNDDDDDDEDEVDDNRSTTGCVNWINNYLDLSLLADPMFILMCLSVTLMSTGSPYMLYYLPAYVLSAGYTKSDAGYLVAISAALDLTGRLGFGYLSDLQLFDRRKAFVVCILGAGSAVLLLSVAQSSFYGLATAVGTYGLCVGSWYLLMPVLLADVFGTERISSSYGLIRMFQGVGAISVPPLTGFLRDLTGTYDTCFYSMGACMMLGSIPLIVSIILSNDEEDGDGEDGEDKSEGKCLERSP